MSTPSRRYWAIRTDRHNKSLLLSELRAGRLRQGWGHDDSQNLELIQAEIARDGKWWERLTENQKEVLLHLRMLSTVNDSMKVGDWVLLPNLPDDGPFLIAEVTGNYSFEPLALSEETDINGLGRDYGHVLPVRLITENGINRYAEGVNARIRSTLKTPMRMWNADGYRAEIEQLVEQYRIGSELSIAVSGEARLHTAWELALSHAAAELQQHLGSGLDDRFQAAEWEEPIKLVLENLYPGTDVRWVAGRNEAGADVIVQLTNHFGGIPWIIVVQVKNYTGEIDSKVLEQLRTAHGRYSTEGKILSLVVMTTAERMSQDFIEGAPALEKELTTPVKIVLRKEMMKILTNGLMARMGAGNDVSE